MKRRHPATTSHNYLAKIAGMTFTPGATVHVRVGHEAWCDVLDTGGFCNCDPEIQSVEDVLALVERHLVN